MTQLLDKLRAHIALHGPMRTSTYMTFCLHDPEHGYYATRPGLGRDFATSPEISQVFGELIGVWVVDQWERMGRPSPLWLVEAGPGRGLMMADILRVARTQPAFLDALQVALLETSPVLRHAQLRRLAPLVPGYISKLDEIDPDAAILVANEWLDCFPVDQFVRGEGVWRERLVGLAADGRLSWGLGPHLAQAPVETDADEVEAAGALDNFLAEAAQWLQHPLRRMLLIDYGSADTSPRDSLRAYRDGRQVDPLEAPGESDLTVDVDFPRLARTARQLGLAVAGPVPQGAFLLQLGAEHRVQSLAAANPARADEIWRAALRLIAPEELGERFKVVCLSGAFPETPAGFGGAAAP